MDVFSQKLWLFLKEKSLKRDEDELEVCKISEEYIVAIKKIVKFGIDRSKTIRDVFPFYTLHDEVHICNVLRIMYDLIGEKVIDLTCDEVAMLILCACCHDIGMSYNPTEKDNILSDSDRLNKYLDSNPKEYIKAYSSGNIEPNITEEMMSNYLRTIHHERVSELLYTLDWPSVLVGKVDRHDLIKVCQSHGTNINYLDAMEATSTIDLRLCSILLRLADILDFDATRAPKTIYEYNSFDNQSLSGAVEFSKQEWDKHVSSKGFTFVTNKDTEMYQIEYNAVCKLIQVEQAILSYVDWVDFELNNCSKLIKKFSGRWSTLYIPQKVLRKIISEGYVSGQFKLTLEHNQVLDILVGKAIYSDPSTFVRELIQNAIDAVRTRKQFDKNLPAAWKPQINIRTWMDNDGYHWFRIEDNGIGMSEEIITDHFLKIGNSYYNSDSFNRDKIRCKADPSYMPISRFGIGILSCFMGDSKVNLIEVSTKRFNKSGEYNDALRLKMHGLNGYYYLANKGKHHSPGEMKGVTSDEKQPFLRQAGTAIAVRTNLYQTGKYNGFKEIIDKYVVFPEVAIHYDGAEGSFNYCTEKELLDEIANEFKEKDGEFFELQKSELDLISAERPELNFLVPPKIVLNCYDLSKLSESEFMSGICLVARVDGKHEDITIKIGEEKVSAQVELKIKTDSMKELLYLVVDLNFNGDFNRRMSLISDKLNDRRERFFDIYDIVEKYNYTEDEVEIFESIQKGYYIEPDWERYIAKKYKIDRNKLQSKIVKILNHCDLTDERDFYTKKSLTTYNKFRNLKTYWEFKLCDLCDSQWYNNLFARFKTEKSFSIIAHNGILCGESTLFCNKNNSSSNLGNIMLLKDKYRPDVDVSRDVVKSIPLEVMTLVDVVRNLISDDGFSLRNKIDDYNSIRLSYMPMLSYLEVFEVIDNLQDKLSIKTDAGKIILSDIPAMLSQHQNIKLSSPKRIFQDDSWGSSNEIVTYNLCISYIRNHFSLKFKKSNYSSELYITQQSENLDEYANFFPPTLFLSGINGDEVFLANKSAYSRYFCNKNHPFSIFLINNAATLIKYTPGLFARLVRILAESEKNTANEINIIILNIKALTGLQLMVPENIILSEKDFI